MPYNQPFQVTGFHSCDREVGLKILNGNADLIPSNNPWDWLGYGTYFWEQNPGRALEYAIENAAGKQFNKIRIKTPFVLGATIGLGNCLNLVEANSLAILRDAYQRLMKLASNYGEPVPVNKGNNKALDCVVFAYIHELNELKGEEPYDTIRYAFQEGGEVYPGSTIMDRLHIQICVINTDCIEGYFLPKPVDKFNPYLRTDSK